MNWNLPTHLDKPHNNEVAAYLRRVQPSAHDDVSSELSMAIEGLTEVKTFCPDLRAYAYVVAHDSGGRIFALAVGQSAIGIRVGEANLAKAVIDRADPAAEIGKDWAWFRAFDADEPTKTTRARLGRWCRMAFMNDTQ